MEKVLLEKEPEENVDHGLLIVLNNGDSMYADLEKGIVEYDLPREEDLLGKTIAGVYVRIR